LVENETNYIYKGFQNIMVKLLLPIPIAYLLGSIPFGLLIVHLISGQDVRTIESGRTGGTNAMRAAGILAGLVTALLDILKGAAAIWISRALSGGNDWVSAICGLLAVIGHNYSAFLIRKDENGKLCFSGGAGGATTLGVAIGLWAQSWLIIFPLAAIFYVVVGYASLTTISIALSATCVFLCRAIQGKTPWAYLLFSLGALATVLVALKPNLQRLKDGTERRVNLLKHLINRRVV